MAGRVVQLEGLGREFGGRYRITSATHTIDSSGYRTSFEGRKEIWFGSIPALDQGAVALEAPFVDVAVGGGAMSLFPEFAWQERPRRQQFTIALAEVVNTVDSTGNGRVQVQLPWLPGTQPWARVAVPAAGSNRGMYMLPHEGDEVLVAFNRSDVSDCYVIGSLWSTADTAAAERAARPDHEDRDPDRGRTRDRARRRRASRSSIKTATGHKVELGSAGPSRSPPPGDTASIKLGQAGDVTIEATTSITLRAKRDHKSKGTGKVEVESSGNVSVNGGATCKVKATTILLN